MLIFGSHKIINNMQSDLLDSNSTSVPHKIDFIDLGVNKCVITFKNKTLQFKFYDISEEYNASITIHANPHKSQLPKYARHMSNIECSGISVAKIFTKNKNNSISSNRIMNIICNEETAYMGTLNTNNLEGSMKITNILKSHSFLKNNVFRFDVYKSTVDLNKQIDNLENIYNKQSNEYNDILKTLGRPLLLLADGDGNTIICYYGAYFSYDDQRDNAQTIIIIRLNVNSEVIGRHTYLLTKNPKKFKYIAKRQGNSYIWTGKKKHATISDIKAKKDVVLCLREEMDNNVNYS